MLKLERQKQITQKVIEIGFLSIGELAESLGVSPITIRRDIDELDRDGQIIRIRGGAQSPNQKNNEPPVILRQKDQRDEKIRIAQKALEFIDDDDVVALEMGTTTWELARLIAKKNWKHLHVITNGIPIVQELIKIPKVLVTCVGGTTDPDELANFGVMAESTLRQLNINKLFIGCRGIKPETGMTNTGASEMEIGTIQAFVDVSNCVVVLADHTKIGQTFFIKVLPTSKIDFLITTDLAAEEELQSFTNYGVKVVRVPEGARRGISDEIRPDNYSSNNF